MDLLAFAVDLFLHLDRHLGEIITSYGTLTYLILFAVIFLETGVVITPFLPGDSLLFAIGAFSATGALNVGLSLVLLFIAAILGDTVNYWIGNKVGPKVFERDFPLLKREHLVRTQEFYERHGGKTIFLARFLPIIRTFAPFVAGVGTMEYSRFLFYNVFGAFVWTTVFILGGYFFGNLRIVKDNFSLVILVIIIISVLPMGIDIMRRRLVNRREAVG